MKCKLYFRKCPRIDFMSNIKAILDIDKFKKCDPPFGGETIEEFKQYIQEMIIDNIDSEEFVENNNHILNLSVEEYEMLAYPNNSSNFMIVESDSFEQEDLFPYIDEIEGE